MSLYRASVVAVALLLSPAVMAADPVTPTVGGDGIWYYEIGGARAVSPPPNPHHTRVTVNASADLRLGYSCGVFDPVLSVSNILEQVSQGAERMVDAMVLAAQAAIASLPAYILQRANPGLYDLFQNALLKAEETVNLATKTCEQMEAEIAQGKDPYREWAVLSKGNDWKLVMGTEPDVVRAKATVEDTNGDRGLPWIGGSRGGQGQEPIRLIGDTVAAGYNLTLNRAAAATGGADSGTADARLLAVWPDPTAARDWAVAVLGEKHITTCADCSKDTVPGGGLLPQVEVARTEVSTALQKLVVGETPLTLTNLEAVAAPGVALNAPLIQALRRLPDVDRTTLVLRLTDEISTARTIEQALLARRLLLTGQRVPEVQAIGVAQDELGTAVAELEREIDNLLFEKRIRQDLVSQTAAVVLRHAHEQMTDSFGQPRRPADDPYQLREGAVRERIDEAGGVTP